MSSAPSVVRRTLLSALGGALVLWGSTGASRSAPQSDAELYAAPGPLGVSRLPLLEHTASSVYPDCVGDKCLLRISVFYPRGGTRIAGIGPPYPLAILSPGFLVSSDSYQSYAEVRQSIASHTSC